MQSVAKIKFHEPITTAGEIISFFPLQKYVAVFDVFYDSKTQIFQLVNKKTKTITHTPMTNVAWYELEAKKLTIKKNPKTKTKPELV